MKKIDEWLYEDYQITSEDLNHYHKIDIDRAGNGKTIETIGRYKEHEHKIKNFEVEKTNGHTHIIA